MLDVYIIHDDEDHRAVIKQALAQVEESPGQPLFRVELEREGGREGLTAITGAWSGRLAVAIVRVNLPDMEGLELIRDLRNSCPGVQIVPVLEGDEHADIWQHLLEMELRSVLQNGKLPEEMAQVMAQVYENLKPAIEAEPGQTKSFVISVIGSRGGVGKSIVATNLVCAMAKKIDPKKEKVLLLDLSLNAGDIGLFMDAPHKNTIMDAVRQGEALDSDYFGKIMYRHPNLGVHLLASPTQEFDSGPFDYNMAALILACGRDVADFVVVDTGVSQSGPAIAAVDYSDLILLVTTRDIVHLVSTGSFIRFMKQERGVPISRIKVIVNLSDDSPDVTEAEVEGILAHPVTAYLPSDAPNAVTTINDGTPMVVRFPKLPMCQVFDQLADLGCTRWGKKPRPETNR